ncbi:hypothetical protein GCM10023093_18460 [Nemorincola caseinilytica]|uniref:Bacterial surface antigen (D15) domain-containing protein n=2 Tax=Nemorincola caseinilytica TaxID=2054315 RepID=A0ABP8NE12_9BACT
MTERAAAQSNIEIFGQNRVQERKFSWKFFDTKHFRIYHYDKMGVQLGRYVAEEAEYDMGVVERRLGSQFPQRFNIILYNDYDDYRQTNIGLKDQSPTTGNMRAGSLKIVDDKLVLYFTGEHSDLRRQIRSGMSLVVMQRMLFGENVKKKVKNSLTMNLPAWVSDGYIAYLVDGWDQKSNSMWKGVLEANPGKGFYELAEDHPELAGKAFWKFIANQYGPGKVKTLLYDIQSTGNLNKATKERRNLNMKVTKAYDSCINYYKVVYRSDELHQERPDSTSGILTLKVPKDKSVLRNIRVSPDGTNVAFVMWKNGQYKVMLQKSGSDEGDATVLVEGGQKDFADQVDPNYPMLAWSKTGSRLAVLYMRKDVPQLRVYNNTKGRVENYVIPKKRFDRLLSMSFAGDDGTLLFSAIKKSQTDLYQFTIKGSKMVNITDDVWDDLSPEYVISPEYNGILFVSNRPRPNLKVQQQVNELPVGPLNMFFYDPRKGGEMVQCTYLQKGFVSQPIQYGDDAFAYLHDSNGVNNRYVVIHKHKDDGSDSLFVRPVTNYATSILNHQYSYLTGNVADVVLQGKKYVAYFHERKMPTNDSNVKVLRPTILSEDRTEPAAPAAMGDTTAAATPAGAWQDDAPEPPKPEIKGGNAFQSEFSDNEDQPRPKPRQRNKAAIASEENEVDNGIVAADSSVLTVMTDSAYLKMKPAPYRGCFKPDYLSVKLDNSILFNQYQSTDANGGRFANPTLGALSMINLNELFENHRITGGFQLPLQSPYSAYFVQYQNFTNRWDWGFFVFRRQQKESLGVGYTDQAGNVLFVKEQLFKSTSDMAQFDLSYPIDRLKSVRFHTGVRHDKMVQKITDTLSLIIDPISNNGPVSSFNRLEFVFDNTISPTMNILYGTRYKVYAEYMSDLRNTGNYCYNIGLDVRNYQRLHKHFILATRLAYAHSDGTKKVQYLVGGVDNWLSPKAGPKSLQGAGPEYGFQMLATSLRGYKQYARVGNNFSVLSNELRLPLVTTFVKRPVRSAILKNLQAVGFVDVGYGWTGFLPKDKDYEYRLPLMPTSKTPIKMTLVETNNVAAGYGIGMRTLLFGYFLRVDCAWDVEEGKIPMWHFALGTDF